MSKAEGLFQNDQELLEVRLPGNLSIPQSCFAECTKLHTVHIPTSIETIGMMAFQNCQALSNFEIYGVDVYDPDNVEKGNRW